VTSSKSDLLGTTATSFFSRDLTTRATMPPMTTPMTTDLEKGFRDSLEILVVRHFLERDTRHYETQYHSSVQQFLGQIESIGNSDTFYLMNFNLIK